MRDYREKSTGMRQTTIYRGAAIGILRCFLKTSLHFIVHDVDVNPVKIFDRACEKTAVQK